MFQKTFPLYPVFPSTDQVVPPARHNRDARDGTAVGTVQHTTWGMEPSWVCVFKFDTYRGWDCSGKGGLYGGTGFGIKFIKGLYKSGLPNKPRETNQASFRVDGTKPNTYSHMGVRCQITFWGLCHLL